VRDGARRPLELSALAGAALAVALAGCAPKDNPAVDVTGAPCPAVSKAAFDHALQTQGLSIRYSFDYDDLTLGRAFGEGNCDEGGGGLRGPTYQVCQFTSPAILSVKSPKGEFYFLPGLGQKASITTKDGTPRCVLAAPLYAQ